jgi:hypothetical protein
MPEGPELISNEIVEVIDESIQITINDYIDGDAYIITIYPPSSKPEISGPISGKPKTKYDYKFLSESPMESDLYYYIEWGDGNIEDWLGPFSSGEEITINHSWNKKGSYTVQAKVKDTYNLESNWGSLEVSMPKYKILNFHLFNNWFFELLKLCFSPVSRWV